MKRASGFSSAEKLSAEVMVCAASACGGRVSTEGEAEGLAEA
jgi:hypothetical protein